MDSRSKESLRLVADANAVSKANEQKLMESNNGFGGMDIVCAGDLPETCTPPDELLEGIFVCGEGSVVYGATNSGKTFVTIDIAAAISQGKKWMGRRTEPGIVLYLAAEAPASVQRRMQAYQKYYNVRLNNIYVVRNPIDLFSGESDTLAIIQIVRHLEKQTGKKVRLIVGDTLARMSAGANENAGQDMGVVVRHFDLIRSETDSHFTLVHHSGKNAAAGARGWSGVRAAVDTEIEITDDVAGRCIEITKQRDLDTKGERLGFRLESVDMGISKWGKPMTTCIVLPWDAPAPEKNAKKKGEISGAILQILRKIRSDNLSPIDKKSLVGMLDVSKGGNYLRTSVYRELDKLVAIGEVVVFNGEITLK